MGKDLDPGVLESALDGLALELLGGMFPGVDVEAYYRAAVEHVEMDTKGHRDLVQILESMGQFSRLSYIAMNRAASAYVLITGRRDERGVDRLMKKYEALIKIYLEDQSLMPRTGDS